MEAREYRTVDKSTWERGAWDDEPDKMQWTDEATGLPCLIVRNPIGALCGYVGVAEGHRLFGVSYEDARKHNGEYFDVHGSLTFSDKCREDGEICHIPGEGEPDLAWWLGFDCAHLGDYMPALSRYADDMQRHESYKDIAYVKAEVHNLAEQLKEDNAQPA